MYDASLFFPYELLTCPITNFRSFMFAPAATAPSTAVSSALQTSKHQHQPPNAYTLPVSPLQISQLTPSTDKAKNSHSEELLPLIVYFHGGGFTIFAADSMLYDNLCSRLAAGVHAVVVSVNYRLAPEHNMRMALMC